MTYLDQSFGTAGTGNNGSALRYDTSIAIVGQQFIPDNVDVKEVKLSLKKFGTPSGNAYVAIYSDNGSDLPNSQIGSSSGALDVSTVTSSYALYTFTFASAISVTPATKYWIVLSADYSYDNNNLIAWEGDTGGGYASGIPAIANSTPTWTSTGWPLAGGDHFFEEYSETAPGSESSSISLSPSASPSSSPSASQSPSSSISSSPSSSISSSPSVSESASISLSPSVSESASPSLSPSVSVSASPSVSASSSVSLSPSVSASSSISPSPSEGYADYTRGNYAALPTDDTDLETNYTAQDVIDVATADDVRVGQAGLLEFMIHQYKNFVGSYGDCDLHWEGQTTLAPSSSTVYLQIYNHNTPAWETVDSDNSSAADTDFTLTGYIADLTNYKDASNVISCRIYQEAI